MSVQKRLRTKTLVLLGLMILFGPLGDVLLGKGMKQIGAIENYSPGALGSVFFQTFTSPTIWLGIAALIVFFICYLLVLTWADYSYVMPASAASYAVVPMLAALWLQETVTPTRWLGVALISLGVALVGITSPSTAHLRKSRSAVEPS